MKTVKQLLALSVSSALAFSAMAEQASTGNDANDDDVEVVEVYGAVSSFGATKSQTPIVEMAR